MYDGVYLNQKIEQLTINLNTCAEKKNLNTKAPLQHGFLCGFGSGFSWFQMKLYQIFLKTALQEKPQKGEAVFTLQKRNQNMASSSFLAHGLKPFLKSPTKEGPANTFLVEETKKDHAISSCNTCQQPLAPRSRRVTPINQDL